MSERESLSLITPVKPKVPALRSARHDPQLDACAARIGHVVACLAGLQPSNCIRSEPTALGFAIMPPALRCAECLISKLKLSHVVVGWNLPFNFMDLYHKAL